MRLPGRCPSPVCETAPLPMGEASFQPALFPSSGRSQLGFKRRGSPGVVGGGPQSRVAPTGIFRGAHQGVDLGSGASKAAHNWHTETVRHQ